MTECAHCHKPLPNARPGQRYCKTSCQSAAWAKRKRDSAKPPKPEPEVGEVEVEAREVDEPLAPVGLSAEEVRQLVFEFHAPEPFTIDPGTGHPLWRFRELAELFGVSEFELREVLVSRGQPFMKVSIGTSAGMLVHG